jgi:sugar-specific transcriptional regulator TrmB
VTATGVQALIVGEVLERLTRKGLLVKEAGSPVAFHYVPPNREFSVTLDKVLERYEVNAMDILRIMSANSIERLRLAALRAFFESLRGRGPRRH